MSDEPVQTQVLAGGRWQPFQEFMILSGAAGPVEGVELRGADSARPTPDVLAAIESAETIVIGPSNPAISIGPILALPGMREALRSGRAPVVAVSPFVGGRSVKGPTELFFQHAGYELSAGGVAEAYEGLLDGIIADEPVAELPHLEIDTRLDTPEARRTVAERTLQFADSLRA
jgi:LPPG:FO 2-phospho-L-lactate transferase